jgi:hypothetical protein
LYGGELSLAEPTTVIYSRLFSLIRISSDWSFDGSSEFDISMHRVTARALLVLVLAGVLAPVASATFEPVQPPFCCARRCCRGKMAQALPAPDRNVEAPPCCRQDCSRAVTASLWAELPLPASTETVQPSAMLPPDFSPLQLGKQPYATHDVRGPPHLSLA